MIETFDHDQNPESQPNETHHSRETDSKKRNGMMNAGIQTFSLLLPENPFLFP